MPLPAILLPLLSNRLVWYVGGLILVSMVSFIGGCNQGAKGKEEIRAEFNAYKTAQALIVKGIQETAKQDALVANQKLKNQERTFEENESKAKSALSKLRKELDTVVIDRALVQLLNESALGSRQEQPPTRPEQQVNEPTHESPGPTEASKPTTLGDLSEVVIENNKNHLSCVAQVEAWQKFYNDLYQKFEQGGGSP